MIINQNFKRAIANLHLPVTQNRAYIIETKKDREEICTQLMTDALPLINVDQLLTGLASRVGNEDQYLSELPLRVGSVSAVSGSFGFAIPDELRVKSIFTRLGIDIVDTRKVSDVVGFDPVPTNVNAIVLMTLPGITSSYFGGVGKRIGGLNEGRIDGWFVNDDGSDLMYPGHDAMSDGMHERLWGKVLAQRQKYLLVDFGLIIPDAIIIPKDYAFPQKIAWSRSNWEGYLTLLTEIYSIPIFDNLLMIERMTKLTHECKLSKRELALRVINYLINVRKPAYPTLTSTGDLSDRSYGNVTREAMFRRARVVSELNGWKVRLLGCEIESVAMAETIGLKALFNGLNRPKPFGIGQDCDKIDLQLVGEVEHRESRGQMKLRAVDFPVIALGYDVIAVGGSPGSHFSKYNWIDKHLYVFDLVKPQYGEFLGPFRSWTPKGEFSVLWDLRGRFGDREDMSEFEWLDTIYVETIMMYTYFIHCVKSRRCKAFSHKIRPVNDFVAPGGRWIFQPYANSKTFETRIISTPPFTFFSLYSKQKYEEQTLSWNRFRALNPLVEREQERRIGEMFISSTDMSAFSDRISGYSVVKGDLFEQFEDYPIVLDIANFSISNVFNDRSLVNKFLKRGMFWCSLPNQLAVEFWDGRDGYHFVEGKKGLTLQGNGYHDYVYSPYELGGYVYSWFDLVAIALYGEFLKETPFKNCCGGLQSLSNLWFIATSFDSPLFDVRYQTWINGLTHLVKIVTAVARPLFGHSHDSLFQIRRMVFLEQFRNQKPTQIMSSRVIGSYMKSGKRIYVSASGHLINLLLSSGVYVVDFRRLTNVYENNQRYINNDPTTRKNIDSLAKRGLLVERDFGKLWHSYEEYALAYPMAMRLAEVFQMEIPEGVRDQNDLLLRRLKRTRGITGTSVQVREYLAGLC